MDLALVTTQEMVDELKTRYAALAVVGSRDYSEGMSAEDYWFSGDVYRNIGACARIIHRMNLSLDRDETNNPS